MNLRILPVFYMHTMLINIGRIPYWEKANELLELEDTLRDNQYIRNESVQFW